MSKTKQVKPKGNPASKGNPAWIKGVSGNPNGRPQKPEELRLATNYTKNQMEKTLNDFLALTENELLAQLNDLGEKDATMLEKVVGRILTVAADEGDHQRLGFIFDRIYGKVQDRVKLSGDPESPVITRVEAMTYEQRLMEVKRLQNLRMLSEGE